MVFRSHTSASKVVDVLTLDSDVSSETSEDDCLKWIIKGGVDRLPNIVVHGVLATWRRSSVT